MRLVNLVFAAMTALSAWTASAETRLVMVEQAGCIYCARWDADIAPVWPKTEAGQRAPLRRVDLHDLPDDIDFASRPRLTPTFVITVDGVEKGRMEGYAGDEFFWVNIERLIELAAPEVETEGG